MTETEAKQFNPLVLAFMGDSVYGQLVRERLVLTCSAQVGKLHSLSVKTVCASFQSKAVDEILPVLTDNEVSVFKRGRNAGGNTVPKSSNVRDYRRATGLECLFGFLYLTGNNDRIEELFEIIWALNKEEQVCST